MNRWLDRCRYKDRDGDNFIGICRHIHIFILGLRPKGFPEIVSSVKIREGIETEK